MRKTEEGVRTMADEVTYEVFALKYADSPGRRRHENFIHGDLRTHAAGFLGLAEWFWPRTRGISTTT